MEIDEQVFRSHPAKDYVFEKLCRVVERRIVIHENGSAQIFETGVPHCYFLDCIIGKRADHIGSTPDGMISAYGHPCCPDLEYNIIASNVLRVLGFTSYNVSGKIMITGGVFGYLPSKHIMALGWLIDAIKVCPIVSPIGLIRVCPVKYATLLWRRELEFPQPRFQSPGWSE